MPNAECDGTLSDEWSPTVRGGICAIAQRLCCIKLAGNRCPEDNRRIESPVYLGAIVWAVVVFQMCCSSTVIADLPLKLIIIELVQLDAGMGINGSAVDRPGCSSTLTPMEWVMLSINALAKATPISQILISMAQGMRVMRMQLGDLYRTLH